MYSINVNALLVSYLLLYLKVCGKLFFAGIIPTWSNCVLELLFFTIFKWYNGLSCYQTMFDNFYDGLLFSSQIIIETGFYCLIVSTRRIILPTSKPVFS